METTLRGKAKEVTISDKAPTVFIGERINGTGSRKIREALSAGHMDTIHQEAAAQVNEGADVLDINVSIAGADELELLPQVVREVLNTVDVPICLDTSDPRALEAGLKACAGKPLVNSVTGEEQSLHSILPLVKDHGAAVIGLLMDDEGISDDADRRVSIALSIIEHAQALGIPPEDVLIDPVVQSVGANDQAALVTIETIRRLREKLPINIVVAGSNVSFGLPDRGVLNNAFVAICLAAGATCAIVNPVQVRPIVLATDLIMGRDRYARRYIQAYRQRRGK